MNTADKAIQESFKTFHPPDFLKPSEWAQRHLVLTRGVSARPGRLVLDEWQREPADCILDGSLSSMVLVWPSNDPLSRNISYKGS
jgi:hypothetical protein